MTKKLHITLDLPDDVAARMRESFIGDRLKFETRRSIEDLPLTRERHSRFSQMITVLLLLGLFGTGAVTGYVTAAGYLAFLEFADRLKPTSAPVPGRTASARQQTQVTPAPAPMTGAPQPQSVTLAPPSALSPHTPSASPIRSSGESGGSTKASSSNIYRVQVGAFRYPQNADALVRELQSHGFKAYTNLKAGLHLVQVGAFSDRKGAEALAKELKAKRFGAFIVHGAASRRR